jgi:hypothetical protein
VADPRIVAIRIRRGNAVFHVHGQDAGLEGVWLAAGQVAGIYESPIKSTWKTGAFQVGSTQKAVKRLQRDMELGFHVVDTFDAFEFNESLFRQIFFYEDDQWSETPKKTTIEVVTEMSGTRKLDVLMYEQPDFNSTIDPIQQQYGNLIMKLRAGQPMWYQDNVVSQFTSTATSAAGNVTVSNPTDQVMWHKWVLTPAIWTLPDFQWVGDPGERIPGGAQGSRYINDITITSANGGAVIDLDRSQLMYRDVNNTNILGQQGANKIFTFPVPPYTPEFKLPVSYKGKVGGATVQLVQPRYWSRPYGLEGVTVLNTSSPKDLTQRFSFPGSFSFEIPTWAERLDIVAVGGGGGGESGGSLVTGSGGSAATWAYKTVIRGVDIPYATRYVVGTVGAGGAGGAGYQVGFGVVDLFTSDGYGGENGKPGVSSTVVASGMTTLTATGGAAGIAQPTVSGAGLADLSFNGKIYPGAQIEYGPGNNGNHPAGGGAGGWPGFGKGGAGGDGQVWIRAYGWSGS